MKKKKSPVRIFLNILCVIIAVAILAAIVYGLWYTFVNADTLVNNPPTTTHKIII